MHKGDKIFEQVFREYYTPLCNFANKYIGDWEQSQDIVQSTFLKVWNNWASFGAADSKKSYLYRAVKNTLIDQVKKDKRLSIREDEFKKLNRSSEKELDSYIIRVEILKSLENLKPKQRKIFILNKLEGLTYPEIAEYLKISERTVEDNMAKAFKGLRADLSKNEHLLK